MRIGELTIEPLVRFGLILTNAQFPILIRKGTPETLPVPFPSATAECCIALYEFTRGLRPGSAVRFSDCDISHLSRSFGSRRDSAAAHRRTILETCERIVGGRRDLPLRQLLSNETTFQYVIPDVIKIAKQGRVYMGVGPEQNFSYMVALKPSMAFNHRHIVTATSTSI
jgi:hypothetical protein